MFTAMTASGRRRTKPWRRTAAILAGAQEGYPPEWNVRTTRSRKQRAAQTQREEAAGQPPADVQVNNV